MNIEQALDNLSDTGEVSTKSVVFPIKTDISCVEVCVDLSGEKKHLWLDYCHYSSNILVESCKSIYKKHGGHEFIIVYDWRVSKEDCVDRGEYHGTVYGTSDFFVKHVRGLIDEAREMYPSCAILLIVPQVDRMSLELPEYENVLNCTRNLTEEDNVQNTHIIITTEGLVYLGLEYIRWLRHNCVALDCTYSFSISNALKS